MTSVCEHVRVWTRGSILKFCLFWGFPCALPMQSPGNDLFVRAAARARVKALFFKKLPVYLLMAPAVGLYLGTKSYTVLIILLYIVPWFYIPLVALISFPIAAWYGSFDLHLWREMARLQECACAEAGQVSTAMIVSRTDIWQRVRKRRYCRPDRRTDRPGYAR